VGSVLVGLVLVGAGAVGLAAHQRHRPEVPWSARVLAAIVVLVLPIGPGFALIITGPYTKANVSPAASGLGLFAWLGLPPLLSLVYAVLAYREHQQTKAWRTTVGLTTYRKPVHPWVPLTLWFLGGPLLFLPASLALVTELLPSKTNMETAGSITVVAFLVFWVLGAGLIAVWQPYRRRKSARRQEDADYAAAGLELVGARPPVWLPTVLARFWMRSRANWWAPVKSEVASQVLARAAIFATVVAAVMGVLLYGWWQHSDQVHLDPHWMGVVVHVLGSLLVTPIALWLTAEVGSPMWQGAGTALAHRKPNRESH
jgi:hypothetical protein